MNAATPQGAAPRPSDSAAPELSIIVPTFREAANLPVLIERVFAALSAAGIVAEMIVVDDNSNDGTEQVVGDWSQRVPVKLIVRREERGLSSAALRGFDEARGGLLLVMDADLSHPPERIADLIAPLRRNEADFVIGSRYVSGGTTQDWGMDRWLNSFVATLLSRPLTSARDPMAGFFCLQRETLRRAAPLNPIGYKIGLELIVKCRCRRVAEVPIVFTDRLHGESKLTNKQRIEYLQHLVRLYRFKYPWLAPMLALGILALILWLVRR